MFSLSGLPIHQQSGIRAVFQGILGNQPFRQIIIKSDVLPCFPHTLFRKCAVFPFNTGLLFIHNQGNAAVCVIAFPSNALEFLLTLFIRPRMAIAMGGNQNRLPADPACDKAPKGSLQCAFLYSDLKSLPRCLITPDGGKVTSRNAASGMVPL